MFIALIVLVAVVAVLIAFRPDFRTDFNNFLIGILHELWEAADAVVTFLIPIIRTYGIIIAIVLVIDTALVTLGLLIHSPEIKAISILLACGLYLVTYLPLGLLLRGSTLTCAVFPRQIRAYVAWLCFIAFLGLIWPEIISEPIVLLGALLVIGIFSGLMSKKSMLPVAAFLTVIIVSATIWEYVDPDSYRVLRGNFTAHKEAVVENIHRNTIETKSDAKSTYGRLLKDVKVAYTVSLENDSIVSMTDYSVSLSKDSTFLVMGHKKDVYPYDGQTFVEIKLPSQNGSFVSGTKLWIDADLVEIGSRKNVEGLQAGREQAKIQKYDNVVTKSFVQSQSSPSISATTASSFYDVVGSYPLGLAFGQESGWIKVGPCHTGNFSSDSIQLTYRDGSSVKVWQIANLPNKDEFKVLNLSTRDVSLLIKS
jgi:hypothetical protein